MELKLILKFQREREREPGESGMSGEEGRTRRVAGADGLVPPDSLFRQLLTGGGSRIVQALPHVASEI